MRGIQVKEYVKVRRLPGPRSPSSLVSSPYTGRLALILTGRSQAPQELRVSDLPDPVPKDDEYLIEVHAAAANFFDILQVQANTSTSHVNLPSSIFLAFLSLLLFPLSLPSYVSPLSAPAPRPAKLSRNPPAVQHSLGSPAPSSPAWSSRPPKSAGEPRHAVGTRVFGAAQGAFATRVCAAETGLLAVPAGWTFAEAAGLFVTAPTSYGALVVRAGVGPGDVVLVHAAAGGVGLAAVQVAKALGATVIATAGSPAQAGRGAVLRRRPRRRLPRPGLAAQGQGPHARRPRRRRRLRPPSASSTRAPSAPPGTAASSSSASPPAKSRRWP